MLRARPPPWREKITQLLGSIEPHFEGGVDQISFESATVMRRSKNVDFDGKPEIHIDKLIAKRLTRFHSLTASTSFE